MSLLKILGLKKSETAGGDADTVRDISRKLDRLNPSDAAYHALFACILSRVANADLVVSEAESRRMEQLLQTLGHLTPDMAALVVEIAKRQNQLFGGVENYLFTRRFKEVSDRAQRVHLLECLLAVAAADESISGTENAEIRKIADELEIERSDFIVIRSKFRDHLAVLKT